MTIKTVSVLGAGVLGSQIAFQTAFHGFDVIAYDVSSEALTKSHTTIAWMIEQMAKDQTGTEYDFDAAQQRIGFTTVLADAVRKADLVIEAVPERIDIKREAYRKIAAVARPETIFATNSSTLLPSALAEDTGRPDRFVALHFANEIWRHNVAEVMGHPGTSPEVIATVTQFATDIGMVPVVLHKEQPGYVLNSLLIPLLGAAAKLLGKGIAAPRDIDRTWKIGTGAPKGPFEIFDIVGLNTVHNIMASGDPEERHFAELLRENYIDKGFLGVASGRGIYQY